MSIIQIILNGVFIAIIIGCVSAVIVPALRDAWNALKHLQ